jgi:hypothetical protein
MPKQSELEANRGATPAERAEWEARHKAAYLDLLCRRLGQNRNIGLEDFEDRVLRQRQIYQDIQDQTQWKDNSDLL